MFQKLWHFIKKIFNSDSEQSNSDVPKPVYNRKVNMTPNSSYAHKKKPELKSFSQTSSSRKEAFDVKEFVTTLEKQIKQHDKSDEKENCLKALSVAQSISQFQSEAKKVDMIQGIISYKEAILTLRAVRWKEGLFCPKCHGKNIKVLEVTCDEAKYLCLDCAEKDGDLTDDETNPHIFDDLTGLDIEKDMASVVKWVLAIYLQCFLSIGKISKYLGVSPEYAIYLIHLVNQDSKINKKKTLDSFKKE